MAKLRARSPASACRDWRFLQIVMGPGSAAHHTAIGRNSGTPEGPGVLRPGMFFTVEPMINLGRPHVKVLSDGWTAVTRDRSLSAQFEHTVAVTETGVEIFTLSPKGLDRPRLAAVARQDRLNVGWVEPKARLRASFDALWRDPSQRARR